MEATRLKKQAAIPAINLYYSVAYMKPHHVACSMEGGEIKSWSPPVLRYRRAGEDLRRYDNSDQRYTVLCTATDAEFCLETSPGTCQHGMGDITCKLA